MNQIGLKFDADKNRYDLIPPYALDEVVKVLTYGSKKYGPENWKYVSEAENRYFAAAQRHLWALRRGETKDKESGLNHIAHAITSLLFLLELSYEPETKTLTRNDSDSSEFCGD